MAVQSQGVQGRSYSIEIEARPEETEIGVERTSRYHEYWMETFNARYH